ncbi:inositol 1,4,5-trisphosphate receptor-interacting protein-like 1 [Numida meleagris]|uniref:inositol 1,4,5-trisphosphate receptor-interacting protein-like 1 n=1 Tax=Numida meleagris TaxID=8996 RepID=UPI000B3E1A3E|nr:inositol 1,4,5-trisphosphate receptor-interacting protein-like 1 [Numida meleagris]
MNLAFVLALLVQNVHQVGEVFDAATRDRMRQRELYLSEKMAQLLLEIEQKNMEQSRAGRRALLPAVLQSWKVWAAVCLLVLLVWVVRKLHQKYQRMKKSSGKEGSGSEEEEEEKEDFEGLLHAGIQPPVNDLAHKCRAMHCLVSKLLNSCRILLSDSFYPVPQPPIGVGSAYEGWCPREDDPVFCLLVPLTAPRGHTFHLELGTARELPARNSRIRVELECTCRTEEETGVLCFLHNTEDRLGKQPPSLLHTLCTGGYLDAEKIARWFPVLIQDAWRRMPESARCRINVQPCSRSCRLHVIDGFNRIFIIEMMFGVRQHRTDIFLSSHKIEGIVIPSTTWPQSCAVAEAKFFRHIAAHAREDSFHLRCMQVWACLLVGDNISVYEVKTAVMHLLTVFPMEHWRARHFLQRMHDILWYLRCCLEERSLEHFLIGNEAVPAEIILPRDFRVSRPLNLFQRLEQEPDNHVRAECELDELPDQFTRLLISQQWQTSTCPQTSFS